MASSDQASLALRLSTLLVLTAITVGLLVWYGSVTASAAVAAASAVVALAQSTGAELTVASASMSGAGAVAAAAAGTAAPAAATDLAALAIQREPWEAHYMYAVSALAGCWVLARLASHWRLDGRTLALVPRADERPVTDRPATPRADSRTAHDASEHAGRPVADGGHSNADTERDA